MMIGYNEYRTNLATGQKCDASSRACVVRADGKGRRILTPKLNEKPDTGTMLSGWSPDGRYAILFSQWESPENAAWEMENLTYRMTEGWLLDSCLYDMRTGKLDNLTAVDRVSIYNGGLFFIGGESGKLGFTAMVDGVSHPFIMDRDGHNKQDLLAPGSGFTYGFSSTPDGKLVSYHEEYQIYIADANGRNRTKVDTGNPFNFGPRWSPDGQWVAFLSGCNPPSDVYVCRRDGTGVRKVGPRNGYRGFAYRYDIFHFHNGDSDLFDWSGDGKWLYYSAQFGQAVEVMRVRVDDGTVERLTHSDENFTFEHPPLVRNGPTKTGIENYGAQVSPDGKWVVFVSNRTGTRQLYVMPAPGGEEYAVTDVKPGWGAFLPRWRPMPDTAKGGGMPPH